ncbi:MAG: translation initiation factor IF-6 [Candidatus Nanohaloarchaea archaeon]
MEIGRYNYLGNSNIGFYGTVTNSQAIFPPEFKESEVFEARDVKTYVARTRLVGLFTAGNSNSILVPDVTTDVEKRKLEEAGISFTEIESRDTALGNLVLANDKGAVIGQSLAEKKEKIEEALEVRAEVMDIAGTPNPGSCGVANSRGVLLHRDTSEEVAEKVKDVLDVEEAAIGTVNTGSPFVGSGILVNDKAVLTGQDTSGPEIGRIDRTLVEK